MLSMADPASDAKSPIEIDVRLSEKQCQVNGNVTVTLVADGKTVFETTREIASSDVKHEEAEDEGKPTVEGARCRKMEAARATSSSTKTSTGEETEPMTDIAAAFHFPSFNSAKHTAQQFAQKILAASLEYTHYYHLPEWLKDNEYLHFGHRAPMPSFRHCYKSIFRLHTETVNIWTHMIGCFCFVALTIYYLTRPVHEVQWEEKLVFSPFLVGAIACLGMSFTFHTVYCHSEPVAKFFNKLDFVGILLLIVGSFVPWVYYGFYCRREPKLIYLIGVTVMGCICLVVTLWDKFGTPQFRIWRTIMFTALGGFGVVPFLHFVLVYGCHGPAMWLVLMGALYIVGGFLYATRIPERFFPGKCDIWWQSHQLFHLCVVAAAITHFRGITEMASVRLRGSLPCQSW